MRSPGTFLLLCTLALTACGEPRINRSAAPRADSPYPKSFKALQRVTLTAGSRQMDFTGYVLVNEGSLRIVALHDFGGTLFDVAARPGQEPEVITVPPGMRKSRLAECAVGAVRAFFMPDFSQGRYRVKILEAGAVPGIEKTIPRRAVVENKEKGVKLEIETLKLEPMDLPERYFQR